jgi:hypothetical protein
VCCLLACFLLLGPRAYELAEISKGNGEKILAFELLILTAGKEEINATLVLLEFGWRLGNSFMTGDAAVGPVAQSCNKPILLLFFFVI